ncbi:MAG: hypothetical protein WC877_05215 [Dehalococcoidales bacterium]|jgi:hypothetical protein
MATDLTNVFGDEICVTAQPQIIHRQYIGYPGANGLTSMHLGTRGSQILITGRLRAAGNTYSLARAALKSLIRDIEELRKPDVAADDYSFNGETFYDCVLDAFELLRDAGGKAIHFNTDKECFCDFVAVFVSLSY